MSSAIDEISIETLSTPNPDALMFKLDEILLPQGTFEYESAEQAGESPLATALFAIEGTRGVLVARSFVTITRDSRVPWQGLAPAVRDALRSFVASGEVAVQATEGDAEAPTGAVEQRILQLIAESVQPALAADGGSIEFVNFEEGIVNVRLRGACGTCPHATATLAFGVQRFLMQHIPEVKGVARVD